MKLDTLILLVLVFSTGLLMAQTDFRPGYIIKESGDTLHGQIDYRSDLLMSSICKFKSTDDKIIGYSPSEIVAYRFIESKYYVSREIKNKTVFLEYLIKGEVSIYYMRDDVGDHYYLDKEGVQLTEIPFEKSIIYVDDKQVLLESKKHIGILNYYMQDAPEFQSRIASMRKPGRENLVKLAEDYHTKVCKDGACIIYEKKPPLLKVNIEIIGGLVKYQNADYSNDRNYFQTGILAHFWMPTTSEKLYFRTGILYSTFEANDVKQAIFKIPLQVEYIYPKGIIRPIVAYGLNIYSPFYQSVAFMGGVNVKLHKSLYCGLNYDVDFNPVGKFPFFPESLLSQSISAGFIVKI